MQMFDYLFLLPTASSRKSLSVHNST